MAEIKEEIINLFSKVWVWFLYVAVGIMAKFSYDILSGKKITLVQAVASGGIALFVGFIASAICFHKGLEREGMWIVPVATLVSDKLVMSLFAINWKSIVSEWFKYWSNKFKDD